MGKLLNRKMIIPKIIKIGSISGIGITDIEMQQNLLAERIYKRGIVLYDKDGHIKLSIIVCSKDGAKLACVDNSLSPDDLLVEDDNTFFNLTHNDLDNDGVCILEAI